MGNLIERGLPCVAHNPRKWERECQSSDAMAFYVDETENGHQVYSAYCHSCEQPFSNNRLVGTELGDEVGIVRYEGKESTVGEIGKLMKKEKREPITQNQIRELQGYTDTTHKMYRGVEDEYHNLYGIRTEYDENEEMYARHYPVTLDYKPNAYKQRVMPKDFSQGYLGRNGYDCDLFGLSRFKDGGKWLLITGGEEDCPAAYKMLRESQISRGQSHVPPVAVVSPTVGEGSAYKQIQSNYEKLEKFEIIVVCLDNDEAGQKATEKILSKLPPGKIRTMACPSKDPCEALKQGKEKEFVNAFYRAKEYLAQGVTGSGDISDKMREEMAVERLPLPPFMSVLQFMMGGGVPLGRVVNVASGSGSGKTTYVNEMIYDWIFNSPYKVGVLSLELDEGEYGVAMLSRHLGKKINLIPTVKERLDYLAQPDVVEKEKKLLYNEDGSHRWMMLDEGEGTLEDVQSRILNMIIQHECKVIVLDPLSDLFDGLTTDEQAVHMRWQKRTVKKYKVIFVNILHVRKTGSGEKANSAGKQMHEEDIHGSSSIFKSGAANILFSRNKYEEDPIEMNTSYVYMPKCRWTGKTGPAGRWYYDIDTHTVHDRDNFFGGDAIEVSEEEPVIQDMKELVYEEGGDEAYNELG